MSNADIENALEGDRALRLRTPAAAAVTDVGIILNACRHTARSLLRAGIHEMPHVRLGDGNHTVKELA